MASIRQVMKESAKNALKIGDNVQARYQGYWYEAEILEYSAGTGRFIFIFYIMRINLDTSR